MNSAMEGAGAEFPAGDVRALAYLMRDWLRAFASDAGTGVDSGMGMGCCDLWVQFGGQEVHIQLRAKEPS